MLIILCVGSREYPVQLQLVSFTESGFHVADRFPPGLLKLWDQACESIIRWRLFAETLTQEKKLNAEEFKKLGFPCAVPVSVRSIDTFMSSVTRLYQEKDRT
jgi:hypothetical protein